MCYYGVSSADQFVRDREVFEVLEGHGEELFRGGVLWYVGHPHQCVEYVDQSCWVPGSEVIIWSLYGYISFEVVLGEVEGHGYITVCCCPE